MKKIIFTLTLIFCVTTIHAELFEVITKNGKTYHGHFVSKTDSTLTLQNKTTGNYIVIYGNMIVSARSREGGRYEMVGGKLTGMSKTEFNESYTQQKQKDRQAKYSNPNYVIGKAFKSSGSIAIGVGVPFFALGAILYGSGVSMAKGLEKDPPTDVKRAKKEAQSANNCMTAGVVFMSTGGSMTILGIPLYVHGKRIMDLSLQVSETGAGVALSL